MAFVCTTNEAGFYLEGFQSGSSFRNIVSVGYDDEKGVVYAGVVGTDPLPGGAGLELYFIITETETETGHVHEYWSGRDTGFIRRPAEREMILASLCEALSELLAVAVPDDLTWFTHDDAPPAKALIKYDIIREVVEDAGMTVTRFDLPLGRVGWTARRLPR